MSIAWPWVLALGLLAGRGEAQSCTQAHGGPNLAKGQPTSQSSTYGAPLGIAGLSSYAVDGNCDGRWSSRSCTHTNQDLNAWWSVDLGKEYAISLVVVKNRQDCCGYRLQGATIHVGDHMGDFSKRSFICGTITDRQDGSLSPILCNGAVGHYITTVIPGRKEFLSLGEVEVRGTDPQDLVHEKEVASSAELHSRISQATTAFESLARCLLKERNISIKTKMCLFRALILPALLEDEIKQRRLPKWVPQSHSLQRSRGRNPVSR